MVVNEIDKVVGPAIDIPTEDDGVLEPGGTPLPVGPGAYTISRPEPEDQILLNTPAAIGVTLLPVSREGIFEKDYFYIPLGHPLRERVRGLKKYKIVPYYSVLRRAYRLWVCRPYGDHGWATSLTTLLGQPAEWYEQHQVQVVSEKESGKYSITFLPTKVKPVWGERTTNELLADALGPNRVVTSADHPALQRRGEVLV